MNKYFIVVALMLLQNIGQSQTASDSSYITQLNQQIDNAVVQQNINDLNKWYAEDFVFSHGSGKVEGKNGWFKSVSKGSFVNRVHDSVTVELHPAVAIVKGKLSVHKKNKEKLERYYLYYIRVYALRNDQWQLISHNTTSEFHEPE